MQISTYSLIETLPHVEVINENLNSLHENVTFHTDNVNKASIFFAITVRKNDPFATHFYAVNRDKEGEYYFDYHQYIDKAIELGATTIVCERLPINLNENVTYIQVENTVKSLKALAANLLKLYEINVIAVTGSSGKTSTVHCLFNVLKSLNPNTEKVYTYRPTPISISYNVINLLLNNQLKKKGNLILELPTDHAGCIRSLTEFTHPSIALLLNVLDAHINLFITRDNIAKAKYEIFENLSEEGTAILNGNNDMVRKYLHLLKDANKILFGNAADCLVRGSVLSRGATSTKYAVSVGGKTSFIETPLIGESGLYIVLAVISACIALGFNMTEVANAFQCYTPMDGRMSWHILSNRNLILYDNTAKTNSVNLTQLINENVMLPWDGYRILILGAYKKNKNVEHLEMENIIWKRITNYFDEVMLVGEKTHNYMNNNKIVKLQNLKDSSEYLYAKFKTINSTKPLYATIVGYIPTENVRSIPLTGIIDNIKQFI